MFQAPRTSYIFRTSHSGLGSMMCGEATGFDVSKMFHGWPRLPGRVGLSGRPRLSLLPGLRSGMCGEAAGFVASRIASDWQRLPGWVGFSG